MATYVNDLRLKEISTGDESGTWGTSTNTNLELIGEALGYATQEVFGSDADATTTIADGASDPARAMYFKITSAGSLTATRTCTIAPNTVSRVMFIENATTGSQSIAISQGSGASVTIATGKTAVVYLDGAGATAAVVDAMSGVDPGVTDTLTEVLVAGNTSGGTNIELSTTDKVQFRDAAIYLNSSVDGQLDIVADTEIQIAATTVDLNGNLDVSGTALVTGVLTTTAATVRAGTMRETLTFGATEFVINDDGLDYNFRVESDTLTSALFVDGGTGNVTMQGATTTIGAALASTNVQLILNGVASKAQRIKFAESGVDKWLIGQGAASETDAFEIYNSNGQMSLSIAKATSAATFSGTVNSGESNVVGIGGTPADVNATEVGPGYINLMRDDAADVHQIQLGGNGVLVGSIGNVAANLEVNSQGGTLKISTIGTERYGFDVDQFYPAVDGATNLGIASKRFDDLFLSGGVYLGGVGAANLLEDYETGTWTPVLSKSTTAPTVTYTTQTGTYTKVGRMIYVSGLLSWTAISGGTGDFHITNLPFTLLNSSGAYPQLVCVDYNGVTFGANDTTFGGFGAPNATYIVLLVAKNNATNSTVISGLAGSGFMYFNLTYQAA
jgi:hypothetical protein